MVELYYDTDREIEIKPGETFFNLTSRFLIPTLKVWGEELYNNFSDQHVLVWAIHDFARGDKIKDNLYCLLDVNGTFAYNRYIDKKKGLQNFFKFLDFIQSQEYYVTDYVFNDYSHMVILSIHPQFEGIVSKFVKGEYSKMYTRDQIEMYIPQVIRIRGVKGDFESITYKVLTKDPEYREIFNEKVNKDFGTNTEIFGDVELEYPPFLKMETFNYEQKRE